MPNEPRRPLAKISTFGISHLHRRNPYMVAWWSAVFPGFGHLLLHQYLRGTLLTLAEVGINTLAHINEAMVFSFCGQFEQAKSVLEPRWVFGYLLVYLLSIWDSYRSALYQNKLCHLAELENVQLPSVVITPTEIQYIELKNPVFGAIYSALFPGMGELYNHRFGLAFYAMFWWWVYVGLSRAHESLLLILHGMIPESISILHPHWLLFMPSVMGGSVYHTYSTVHEHNRLYRLEQRQYLTQRYRNSEVSLFREAGGLE